MFTITERDNENVVVFKDTASQKLKNSVMEAHGDRLPSNWIFSKYLMLLLTLSDYDIPNMDAVNEFRGEIVDSCVDAYTSDLTEWLNDNNQNVFYLSEALDESRGDRFNGFDLLASAQYLAIDEIYSEIVKLLKSK